MPRMGNGVEHPDRIYYHEKHETARKKKEGVAPNAIRGCRRQQEIVSESIRMIGEFPLQDSVGCGPVCPPAWRGSIKFYTQNGTNKNIRSATKQSSSILRANTWVCPYVG